MLDSLIEGMVVAGRYRLESRFATGACGSLWHGRDQLTHLPCTVRLADTGVVDLRAARERFEREAQAAEALRCENVVNVIDHGEWSGMPFIVFESLQGEDLATRLRREGRIAPELVVELVSDVAHALGRAHDLGIVHRDLKPENIFLLRVGQREVAKVLDFGISGGGGASALNRSTKVGHHLGLPLYTSPEQATGGVVDFRSDLWALGAIAYHCLAGRPPFHSEALDELLAQISTAVPQSLRAADLDLPNALDAWCENALSRDPELRFQSAEELADAFARAFQRATLTGHPAPDFRARDARRSLAGGAASSESLARLSEVPSGTAHVADSFSEAPLSRERAAWRSPSRKRALRVSAGAMLALLGVMLGVAVLREAPRSSALAEASLRQPKPVVNHEPKLAAAAPEPAPAAPTPKAPAANAVQSLLPPPTDVAPCTAVPAGPAPIEGPLTPPEAVVTQPVKQKPAADAPAPVQRRERKPEARREAAALLTSGEPDYGI